MTGPAVPGIARPGLATPGVPAGTPAGGATPYLAGQGSQSFPGSAVSGIPPSGNASLMVPVAMRSEGDWLVAVITWRYAGYGPAQSVSVEDTAHNYWDPARPGNGDSSASGTVRTSIWIAPAARLTSTVMVAPTGYVVAVACTVIGLPSTLIGPWVSRTGLVTAFLAAGVTLAALTLGAPASSAILITGCGADIEADILGPAPGGWHLLPDVGSGFGAGDTSADITLAAAWQVASAGESAQWGGTVTADMAGSLCGFLLAAPAPAPPAPGLPVVIHELGVGSGMQTPPSEVAWTQMPNRVLASQLTQGRQYTLGAMQPGQGTLTLDNPDQALIPPGSGPFAGIDSGTPYRQRHLHTDSAAPHYVTMAGYVQRWPPTWDPQLLRGQTVATLTDTWGAATTVLRSILRAEIGYDQPAAYWTCGDAAGSQGASNSARGGAAPPLALTPSKYGTPGYSQAFGSQSSTPLLGDVTTAITQSTRASSGGSLWQQELPSGAAAAQKGFSLAASWGGFPAVSSTVTVEVWFQTAAPAPAGGNFPSLLALVNGRFEGMQLFFDASGHLNITSEPLLPAGGSQVVISSAFDYIGGAIKPLTHVAVTYDQSTWTAWVDGVKAGNAGWVTPLPPHFSQVLANGTARNMSPFSGWIGHVAIYPGALHPGRIITHYYAGLGLAGETASSRVERIAQAGGLTGRRCVLPDTGPDLTPLASCQDLGGQAAATGLGNIGASTVPAVLTVAPTGALYYLARQYAYNQPVQWLLGDDDAAGEIPFLPGYAPDYDPARVTNDIQVAQLDDQSTAVPANAGLEQASQRQYGDQAYDITGYLQADPISPPGSGPSTIDLANWIGEGNSRPRLRVAAVTVEAAANSSPDARRFTDGAANGDLVTCNLRPATAGGKLITVTGRITQTSRSGRFSLDGVTSSITCVIDIAPETAVLTLDDPVLGQLDGNILAW